MKKMMALAMAAVMGLSLTACGGGATSGAANDHFNIMHHAGHLHTSTPIQRAFP